MAMAEADARQRLDLHLAHGPQAVKVTLTPKHLAQLERLRADVARTIRERLEGRERLTEAGEIAEADEAIAADRLTASALLRG